MSQGGTWRGDRCHPLPVREPGEERRSKWRNSARVEMEEQRAVRVAVVTDYELSRRYETINVYRHGGAAKLELSRPERMNAWNAQLGSDLLDAVTGLGQDPDVRAVDRKSVV